MSTLNVNKIADASGGVLAPISSVMRNRIINGAMVIDQRNAGASVTGNNGIYTLDRWYLNLDQNGKFNIQQNAGSVTPPVGFSNYLGVTSTSAYSPTSSEAFVLDQKIEGYNIADLGWGTANAKTVTLSFWVRSSLTGTFSGNFQNSGRARNYVFSYTINSANTWEQKSITIAGDTSGTWLTNNSVGMFIGFSLGTGTSRNTTAGSWGSTLYFGATGSTNVIGTNGATWYITGVQLEVGTQATSFEYRQYGTELALCQRYFQSLSNPTGNGCPTDSFTQATASTDSYGILSFLQPMRSAPTMSLTSTIRLTDQSAITNVTTFSLDAGRTGTQTGEIRAATAGGLTAYRVYNLINGSSTTAINLSAEL